MNSLKSLMQAALGVVLAVALLPIFVWLGLAAIGASIAAILIGTYVGAWQMRQHNYSTPQN